MSPTSAEPNPTEGRLLERFAQALALILHDERPDALSRPVTVAELYQDIAPYRRMRELAGIEIHADYEHALIRLLAGEGGFARLDPDTAADALAIEAESLDPDLSAYRKYAACEVWLMPGERPAAMPEPRPAPPPAAPLLDRSSPPPVAPDAREESDDVEAAPPSGCEYCGHALPSDREVRYCPFCGGDQKALQCSSCGEALEPDWRFCVACGAGVSS